MEQDAFFKPFFNIKNPFSGADDSNWDTVKSSNYVSPDGKIQIHSSFKSKSFGFGGGENGENRPEILSGPSQPLSSLESMSERFNKVSKEMDENFKHAFKDASDTFTNMENQMEDMFGTRRINPKVSAPKLEPFGGFEESVVQPQVEIQIQQAELDRSVFYLLCTMAFMLLLLSGILTAMTYYYRKRNRNKQRPDVMAPEDLDAPPTYNSATQAIVKMTPEGEPLKGDDAPPPYKT